VLRSDLRRIYRTEGIRIDLWPYKFKGLRGAYFNDELGPTVLLAKGLPQDPMVFTMAHELKHHVSLASAQAWAAIFHALYRDATAAQEQAEAAITLSTERGIPIRLAEGVLLRGWALAMQGQTEEGIAQLRQGMAT